LQQRYWRSGAGPIGFHSFIAAVEFFPSLGGSVPCTPEHRLLRSHRLIGAKPFLSSCQVFSYVFPRSIIPVGREILVAATDSVTCNFADKCPYQTAFPPSSSAGCGSLPRSSRFQARVAMRGGLPFAATTTSSTASWAEAFRPACPQCMPSSRTASHARADTRVLVSWVGQQRDGSRAATVPGAPEAFLAMVSRDVRGIDPCTHPKLPPRSHR
jgi:hypothetical protein